MCAAANMEKLAYMTVSVSFLIRANQLHFKKKIWELFKRAKKKLTILKEVNYQYKYEALYTSYV